MTLPPTMPTLRRMVVGLKASVKIIARLLWTRFSIMPLMVWPSPSKAPLARANGVKPVWPPPASQPAVALASMSLPRA